MQIIGYSFDITYICKIANFNENRIFESNQVLRNLKNNIF